MNEETLIIGAGPAGMAAAMELYLLGKGVGMERIFLEERSLDTVG